MKRVIGVAAMLAFGLVTFADGQTATQLQTDIQTLKSMGLPTDAKGLIPFFERKSIKPGEEKELEAMVRRLGNDVFAIRDRAYKGLVERGTLAIPFLKAGLSNGSLEAVRRAKDCIKQIEDEAKTEPVSAAARVLAASKDPRAAEVLLHFVPSTGNDPILEEEVLAAVGRLTITPDKVDPLILNALKDPLAFRRTSAAYLIGRRAGPNYREQLRALLADPDPAVRTRVMQGIYGKRAQQMIDEAAVGDEKLLKDKQIETTEAALLQYFKDKTLSEERQKHFRALVRSMGSSSYVVREQASKELVKAKEGVSVLAFLKEAEYDPNVELSRRAREAIEKIRTDNNAAIPIAVAHLLTRANTSKDYSPGEAIRTLLAYIPFADDDLVEEEVLTCLTLLCIREPKLEPELVKALADSSTTRRAAAAYVLGHVGTKEEVAKVVPLLEDELPQVRLRAGQGMLAARDKRALPTFVKLIEQIAAPQLPKVEEVLYRIADESGPNESMTAGSADSRQKAAKAWSEWLDKNMAKIDLATLIDREAYLGLITVCEYTNQFGNIQGQVWEGSRNGQKRWTFTGVQGAMDAQTLPNGNVLVAENNLSRVTERDSKGNIKWTYSTPQPICVQRLPNGNTFIASYQTFVEIDSARKVVFQSTPGNQYYFFSAHKARNGHIVAINARNLGGGNQGEVVEFDAKGTRVNGVAVQAFGNWCSVEMQPNGNYLVALQASGMIKELDRKGNEVWSKQFPGAFRAVKLPNGNVVAASMNTKQVAEIDRSGNIRWSVVCQGQPWGIHYR